MNNVYLFQVNNSYGGAVKNIYIPYAAGCIEAYCLENERIKNNYDFKKIIYYRMSEAEVLETVVNPMVVLFSCSVWNYEYNKKIAQAIKNKYPSCYIAFGGHSVSSNSSDLEKYDYVDFLTHRFGEEGTEAILDELLNGNPNFYDIPNISFRADNGELITTKYAPQVATEYPSPYLLGVFDDILKDNYNFSAIMETNRGCPNSCTYCDWGSLKSKVRLFSMERVKAELDWFVKNKIEFIFCADGNFCLFSRDKEIAQYVVDCKNKYGYPKVFRVCFTKNKLDTVYEIGMMLLNNGLDKAQTLSFQSMNEEVLQNIGRKNISNDMFKSLMRKYNATNVSTFSELILGLPGETYDSFCKGISILLDGGQHFSFMVYPCELLPNAEMAQPEYVKRYDIKSTKIPFKLVHSNANENEEIQEYGDYVTSTYSMNESEWVKSLIFSKYVQALHCLGLLRTVSIFYRYEQNIEYDQFYKKLVDYCDSSNNFLNKIYKKIEQLCYGILEQKNEFVATCDLTGDILWDFDELIYLELFRNLDGFYDEIEMFLNSCFPDDKLSDVVKYQKDIIKKVDKDEITICSNYNFYEYYNNVYLNKYEPLKEEKMILHITDKSVVKSFEEYAKEVVWFGRSKRCSDYTSMFYDVITK